MDCLIVSEFAMNLTHLAESVHSSSTDKVNYSCCFVQSVWPDDDKSFYYCLEHCSIDYCHSID